MSNQVTGRATVRADGKEYKSMDGVTASIGGESREPVKGGGHVHGYKSKDEEPKLTLPLAHTKDVSLKELGAITNATVILETDTGVKFIYRGAWANGPAELNVDSGTVTLNMSALTCDEL